MQIDFESYMRKCVKSIFDCLESCLESVTLATGKRVVQTFYVSLVFLSLSIILELLGMWSFVSWKEAGVTVLLVGITCLADKSNRTAISKFRNQMRGGKK